MPLNRVVPNLYIGDIRAAQDLKALKAAGITHVVQAMGGIDSQFKDQFKYKIVEVQDSPNQRIQNHFNDVSRWIFNAINQGGSVFVHCWAGVSRSATLVIAYLMNYEELTMDSAMLLCRKAKSNIYPNPGFILQLESYQKYLKQQRYQVDQRARFKNDYATVSKAMNYHTDKNTPVRPAGLRQDWYQMNMTSTQDRLGANGCVNKGLELQQEKPQEPSFQEIAQKTMPSMQYAQKWIHNEDEKPHSYYKKSWQQNTRAVPAGIDLRTLNNNLGTMSSGGGVNLLSSHANNSQYQKTKILKERQVDVLRKIETIEKKLMSRNFFHKTPGTSPRFAKSPLQMADSDNKNRQMIVDKNMSQMNKTFSF